MAHFQSPYGASQTDEYGNVLSTDEYGNVIRRDAYGNVIRTDEYGNVIRTDEYGTVIRTDEYGNPIRHSGTTAGTYGACGFDTTTPQGMHHDVTAAGHGGDSTGKLHLSGSSSSSEDDGQGGRRKKGLMEKIKEKIPGIGHKDHRSATSATTTPGYTETHAQHPHEKKGVLEKIKEKLPGGHHTSEHQY
ncbi:hypothetical protein I3760_07G050300 [Carya illinoinensis]|nr:hypothetical protein I3760_07G050300 [Carya illinoinensis]